MYSKMAKYYEEIFPLEEEKLSFINGLLGGPPAAVLDAGCSTGELVYALAGKGHNASGIELDMEMFLHAARRRKGKRKRKTRGEVSFLHGSMVRLEENYKPCSFDMVLCLGNTLVHLSGPEEIGEFLSNVFGVLKPGGLLVVQILNYERILRLKPEELPKIETDKILFTRRYEYPAGGDKTEFITSLTDKTTGEKFENSVTLYCLTREGLLLALEERGFVVEERFSDFSRNPLGPESFSTVTVAKKVQAGDDC